jgi:ribonucleoside-triphosphate reductase
MKKIIRDGKVGKGLKFLRLRRVTGYITGDYKSRFNDSKIAETDERVKHEVKC